MSNCNKIILVLKCVTGDNMAILITEKDYFKMIDNIEDKPENILVNLLRNKGLKIATAESCTGGMLSEKITNVSGASDVFDCGVCSYANRIKNKILGVREDILRDFGAVSEQTAELMAKGVMSLAGADFGISTTGIAGPTGGTVEKPVGLVYMAVACDGFCKVYRAELCSDSMHTRDEIRNMASNMLLMLTAEIVSETE